MLVISKNKSSYGQYPSIQISSSAAIPTGFYWWPDNLDQTIFNQYEGFVNLVIARDTVKSYTANVEAYEEWKASQPDTEPGTGTDTDMSAYATWDELAKAYKEGVNLVE